MLSLALAVALISGPETAEAQAPQSVVAQIPLPPPPPTVEWTSTPSWAAQTAIADLQTIPEAERAHYRYIWCRQGTQVEHAVVAMAVNHALSRINMTVAVASPAMTVLANGKLIRLNLTMIATEPKELLNLLETWEKLSFHDTDFTATVRNRIIILEDVEPYTHTDGKRYKKRKKSIEQVVRGAAVHVNQELTALIASTGSVVPIIDSRDFVTGSLSTLDQGLYYAFRGIPADIKLEDYLRWVGVSDGHAKLFESPGAAVVSDTIDKAVVSVSRVTGKPRMIVLLPTAGVRPSEGRGVAAVTLDFLDESRGDQQNALRNLADAKADGFEVIVTQENGLSEYSVWNQNFTLFKSAPDGLVSDKKVGPHTNRLQAANSCIVCHGPDSGWRPFRNAVPIALKSGFDIFFDASLKDNTERQQQQLAGMYAGRDWFAAGVGPLSGGQITYDRAVFSAAAIPLKDCAAALELMYTSYIDSLDPWDVARELGINGLPPSDNDDNTYEDSAAAGKALEPWIAAKADGSGPIVQEDGIIVYIRSGETISRTDYESCEHLLYERVKQTMNHGRTEQ